MIALNKFFIYVFSEEDKNKLLSLGYKMLKSDEVQHVYVFNNIEEQRFATNDVEYVLSDRLTF